jgi:cellulose synthase/poly-beta-1,6-N-acetylglucosamine synthase-like glycosyltransferase
MRYSKTRWSVGVVIPAQNEETTIESCIRSVLSSLGRAGVDHWVVVVADHCSDRTVELARNTLRGAGEVIEVGVRAAGAARRKGVAQVLKHWENIDPARIWLANTDADTQVNDDWIAVQLGFADEGVTAVAGIVHLEAGGSAAAHEIYRNTYLTSPEGTHTHVHGANLSVRADAYEDVGGWSNLPLAEDHCLWARLRGKGWRVSSPVSSVVTTSARLEGRAKGGFADTLKARVEALYADASSTLLA